MGAEGCRRARAAGTRQTRTTKDLDLAYAPAEKRPPSHAREAARQDLKDGFVFSVERASGISEDDPGAVRFSVRAEMAGRTFEEIRVDVAFGDPLVGTPEKLAGPGWLAFAGIETPVIPALPLDRRVAEKVHAYTRTYRRQNTRTKDLVDLVLIGSFARLDASRVQEALDRIFAARGTHALPATLPDPPADWRTPYRTAAAEVGLPSDLQDGHRLAARLVDPVLRGKVDGCRWDPARYVWGHGSVPQRRTPRSSRPPARRARRG